mgnify:CR=1 FL=1
MQRDKNLVFGLTTYHVSVRWKNLDRGIALAARLNKRRSPRLNQERALR